MLVILLIYIFASAVDWFTIENNKEVTVTTKLRIWTTDDRVAEAFYPYHFDRSSGHKHFVACRGNIAKKTAHYMNTIAEIYWRSQSSC